MSVPVIACMPPGEAPGWDEQKQAGVLPVDGACRGLTLLTLLTLLTVLTLQSGTRTGNGQTEAAGLEA